jgi:hypothetical protein
MKVLVTKEQYSKLNLTPQSDIGEQDDVEGGEGTTSYPKWETGIQRGPANNIDVTKWSDIVQLTRGKANPIP